MRRIGNAKTSEAEEKLGTVLQGNGEARYSEASYCNGGAR